MSGEGVMAAVSHDFKIVYRDPDFLREIERAAERAQPGKVNTSAIALSALSTLASGMKVVAGLRARRIPWKSGAALIPSLLALNASVITRSEGSGNYKALMKAKGHLERGEWGDAAKAAVGCRGGSAHLMSVARKIQSIAAFNHGLALAAEGKGFSKQFAFAKTNSAGLDLIASAVDVLTDKPAQYFPTLCRNLMSSSKVDSFDGTLSIIDPEVSSDTRSESRTGAMRVGGSPVRSVPRLTHRVDVCRSGERRPLDPKDVVGLKTIPEVDDEGS